ncbi:MAG: hypothetical protein ACRCVJ_12175 [Clostridium sp.]|uniref:hypothetical protein n=1 Tax=Clostridium sp. TaxID=1506 RepID=UPI003F2FC136
MMSLNEIGNINIEIPTNKLSNDEINALLNGREYTNEDNKEDLLNLIKVLKEENWGFRKQCMKLRNERVELKCLTGDKNIVARNNIKVNNDEYMISTVYLGGFTKQFELMIFDENGEEVFCERFDEKEVANKIHNTILKKMMNKEFIVNKGQIEFTDN